MTDINGILFSLDVTTGVATRRGAGAEAFAALAFYGGVLYANSDATNKLYTVNTSTGVSVVVDNDIDRYGIVEDNIQAMAELDGVMYAANESLHKFVDYTPGTLTVTAHPVDANNARLTATLTDSDGIRSVTEARSRTATSQLDQGPLTFRRIDADTWGDTSQNLLVRSNRRGLNGVVWVVYVDGEGVTKTVAKAWTR